MTNEQAIEALKNIKEYWTYRPTEVEAADLAIQALEKQKIVKHYLEQLKNRKENVVLKIVVENVLEDILIGSDECD